MNEIEVLLKLREDLSDMIEGKIAHVTEGGPEDYTGYKFIIGEIKGLETARSVAQDIIDLITRQRE